MVSQLLVAEADALLVTRVEKQAQDVGTALPRRASALDLALDQPVETATSRVERRPRRSGTAQGLHEEVAAVEGEGMLEVLGRPRLVGTLGVDPEEGPQSDPQRELSGPVVEIDPVADAPPGKRP